ncbi:phosphomevalonate decarboxylase MvaD [Haloarchaeobius iranensis]|uniref:Diphosphomevalonate decarboxylase n=1 Tax=Haloarchaeobius iranensis TaxID=996166 RepID=A0A1G9SXZ0_9EURY|nr:phosphomevalonate decarboxylase MvaD [Haloarchaeobius iranensis]SDM40328.1 diphosphomevalonate decarboxylase [Haloarchaeobius iranensis]
MKATAMAHPIQGLVKYHGMRDDIERQPYHDSISVCTAPSHTKTTVEFSMDYDEDTYIVDGEELEGHAFDRVERVVDKARDMSDAAHTVYPVKLESENSFPSNVGLGSSSSGFAAAAMALSEAAELDASHAEISTIARVGSASAARSVTGGFSHLRAGLNDRDCRSHRIPTDLKDELKIIVALVPSYKQTDDAHAEAEKSHMFGDRRAYVQDQLVEMRDALHDDDLERMGHIAEQDSLSLAATTMTGPDGWVYWQPPTLAVFNKVRELRENGYEDDDDVDSVPVWFSTDTGASVYVNTTADHAERVKEAVSETGVRTTIWEVGGPARLLDEDEALF